MLASVLIFVLLMLIALAAAAPKIATEIQRDREAELYHRGLQYTRAIRLYYKQFGKYPSNISQLEKTNGIRFLRKQYRDPITRGGQWRIIHLGEARLRADDPFHVPADFGSGIAGAAQPLPPPPPNGIIASANQGLLQSSSPGPNRSASSSQPFGFSSSSSQPFGFSSTQAASGVPNTAASAATSDPSSTGAQTGSDGQTLGGIGIVGVASFSPKKSMREYKHQQHYNEWEFTYDASLETLGATGLGLPQPVQPAQSAPQNGALLPSALQSALPPDANAPATNPQ
jgi:type II secretory pathway pseudopilin PulG